RENFLRFEDTYWFVLQLLVAFISVMNVVGLGHALGWPVNVPTAVLLGIGAMFMILGNVLPRTRSNWFMGIRTPWTLDSESVWRETHRLGGRTFVLGGFVTMIAAFLPEPIQPIVAIVALCIAGFIPVIYSYLLWRREQQQHGATS
ncbi:MAG TPA: SdpI family protein, partial [Longimicrobiales bacterium]